MGCSAARGLRAGDAVTGTACREQLLYGTPSTDWTPLVGQADFADLESAVEAALSDRNWPATEAQQPTAGAAAASAGPPAAGPSSEDGQVPASSRGSPGVFGAGAQQAQQAEGAGEGRGGSRQTAAGRAAAAAHGGAHVSAADLGQQASKPLRVRVGGG